MVEQKDGNFPQGVEFSKDTTERLSSLFGDKLIEIEDNLDEEEEEEVKETAEEIATREAAEVIAKEKPAEIDEDETPLAFLARAYGYKEDDLDGIDLKNDSIQEIKKFYDKRDESVKDSAIKELFELYPDAGDLAKHLANGGSIDTWRMKQQTANWNFKLEEDDVETQENVLKHHYKNLGFSDKKINTLLETAKDDGELFSEANEIVELNKKAQESYIAGELAKEQKMNAEIDRQNKEIEKQINTTIKSGNLEGRIIIPEKQRAEFQKFVLSEERTKKWNELPLERQLLLDYLVMTDFEVKGLEKPKGKTIVVTKRPTISGTTDDTHEMSFEELKRRAKK